MRLDVAQVETRIVVANTVFCDSCPLAGNRTDSSVRRDESRQLKFVQMFSEVSVIFAIERIGQLHPCHRPIGKPQKDRALQNGFLAKDLSKYLVEILEERPARSEAHPAYVFLG